MPERWIQLTRAFGALFVLAGATWAWSAFGSGIQAAYDTWRYPAIKPAGTLGASMKRDLDDVRRAELTAQYKRVMDALDAAEKEGLIVGSLREKLPAAARMIRAGLYDYARVYLASVETRIPRKREVLAPASPGEDPEEAPAPPPPAPKRRRR
ncbi:MAG: hypothetical protein FD126_2839 [Elusimicrobia bacterium]|nr:MAG: hypothetical protein FD126_2839 [Elusimicrobiota bacterium]